jgi:ABC-type phosphate transport system ATPase subunit
MTLKLQHPFTFIVAGPTFCGKSTFVTIFIECRDKLCDISFEKIMWCHSEDTAPHHLQNVSFFKGIPSFNNPDNIPTLFVLDDLMSIAYSKKVSDLFNKRSHHRNISLILITQNLFHQGMSSRDISLYSKYITVFKNPRDKTQIVF